MGTKFIKNTDNATIICKIPSDKSKVFVFRNKKFDKRNNILVSNGYTEITEEDLMLLEAESSVFQYYIKDGRLALADTLPVDAMSSEQLISALRTEIANLKKELKEKPKVISDSSDAELKAALEKIEAQEKIIEALDTQLIAIAEEKK